MKLFLLSLLSVFGLQQAIPAMAVAHFPIEPFQARYTVYGKGIPLGEAIMTLNKQGNGRYRISFDVAPNNLVALLVSAEVRESASGRFHDNGVRPLHYEQLRKDNDGTRTTQIDFDWQQGTLQARSNGEQTTLPLSPRVVDPVSLYLQVMLDLQQGRRFDRYTFIDDTEFKTYRITYHGEETIETPLGNLRTTRVSQSKPDSSRITTLWFAADKGYLPVQITQEKKGKEVVRMVIRDIDGISNP